MTCEHDDWAEYLGDCCTPRKPDCWPEFYQCRRCNVVEFVLPSRPDTPPGDLETVGGTP